MLNSLGKLFGSIIYYLPASSCTLTNYMKQLFHFYSSTTLITDSAM